MQIDNGSKPSRTNPDVKHFNQWALTYEQSIMQRLLFGPVHTKMLDMLVHEEAKAQPKCILDVGCGTGRFLRAASIRWPQAQLWGVDPAEQMVFEAARLNPQATFKVGFAESLPLPGESADIVVSSLSFHHWENHQKGIHEIARVLSPEGLLCLADHNMLLSKLWREKVQSRKEIQTFMVEAGLTVRRSQRLGLRFVLITLAQKCAPSASIQS
jgi:ubiquinone/menaquinone biosynthesis C-methylase UbiE